MSWVLYLFGSGQALFLGAALVLAAMAVIPKIGGWKNAFLAMVARIGVSATLDSIHLSAGGHERMADEVWKVIGPAYDSR